MKTKNTEPNEEPIEFDFSAPGLFIPVYIPLLLSPVRTKVVYGSRASGKSLIACQKKVMKCLRMPAGKFKCLMVRKMKEDVRESIYSTLKYAIESWGLQQYFKFYEGAPKIVCKLNGGSFLPKGLNQTGGKTGNAKSITNPTDAIIDEADEITYLEYVKLSGSLRGSNEIEEILIFNPPEDDHWLVKYFFPPKESFEAPDGSHTYIQSTVPNTMLVHTTFKNNPFLTPEEVVFFTTLEATDKALYATEGLGLLKATKTGGEALKKFDKDKHVSEKAVLNPSRRALLCWDFNRRPHHTIGVWQFFFDVEANIFRADLVREFVTPEASVREATKEAVSWLKAEQYELDAIRLIGDHSGTKELDAGAETFIAKIEREIVRAGYEVINETKANPRVLPSLGFLNDLFGGFVFLDDQANFPGVKIAIRVNPSCLFHAADFAKTKTDKEGKLLKIEASEVIRDGTEKKTVRYQVRGHGVDEARYMAVGVFDTEYYNYRKKD